MLSIMARAATAAQQLAASRRRLAAVRAELAATERERSELLAALGVDASSASIVNALEDCLVAPRQRRLAAARDALCALGDAMAAGSDGFASQVSVHTVDAFLHALAALPCQSAGCSAPAVPPAQAHPVPSASLAQRRQQKLQLQLHEKTEVMGLADVAPSTDSAQSVPLEALSSLTSSIGATPTAARFRRNAPSRLSIPEANGAPPVPQTAPAAQTSLAEGGRFLEPWSPKRDLPLSARSAMSIESYSSC